MAKIAVSALISDIRKKVGSNVFQKSRAGLIVRKKVSPTQPRTPEQRAVRSSFASLSKAWPGTLTQSKRDGWIDLATGITRSDRLGQKFLLTGLQLYQMCNRSLATISVAPITDAPAALAVGSPVSLTVVATAAAGGTFTVDSGTDPAANEVPVVWATPPFSAGRQNDNKRLRYLFKTTAATAGPWDIKTAYVAKFGTLVSGQHIQVAVTFINNLTGAQSGKVSADVVVAA